MFIFGLPVDSGYLIIIDLVIELYKNIAEQSLFNFYTKKKKKFNHYESIILCSLFFMVKCTS